MVNVRPSLSLVFEALLFSMIGWWLGEKVGLIPNLQIHKVWNLLSVAASGIAAILLSPFVIDNPHYHRAVVGPVADHVHTALMGICVGFAGHALFLFDSGSTRAAAEHSLMLIMGFVGPTAGIVIGTLVSPTEHAPLFSEETRAILLGLYFLFGALVLQFAAALKDLYS